jgi:glycosyltransferase involved in cell wall biosynthesis
MKLFFQGIGVLVGYNWALPYYLSKNSGINILVESQPLSYFMGGFFYHYRCLSKLKFFPRPSEHGVNLSKKIPLYRDLIKRIAERSNLLHLNVPTISNTLFSVKKPKIFVFHGSGINDDKDKKLELIRSKVDAFIAISNYAKLNLQKRGLVVDRVVYHGVDLGLFNQSVISKPRAKKALNLPKDKKVILWSARLSPEKNLNVFLDAIPIISREFDVIFVINIRTISDFKTYKKLISLSKTYRNIIILNWIPYIKMPILYRAADLFMHTSLDEGFGLALTEAMACGIPVLAAEAATAPEILEENKLSLFKPNDPSDLATKALSIISNERLTKNLILRNLFIIKKSFSVRKMADNYLQLYKRIAL